MGGSPKPAVDSIKEILNINQKRNDYLGEPPPPAPPVLPLQGALGPQPVVPASVLRESFHPGCVILCEGP